MKISSNVGNNQKSNPEDIVTIKRALNILGLYSGDLDTPYIDAEIDRGIHTIQRVYNLKEDGLITPDGETQKTIFELSAKSPQYRCKNCGGFHGGSQGDYCPSCTVKL